MKGSH